MRNFILISWCLSVFFVAGCQQQDAKVSQSERINLLEKQNDDLSKELEQAQVENENAKKQIVVLMGLREEGKLEGVAEIQSVKIGGYTGFYDRNKDGVREKLIVYLQPIDRDGDGVKAAGSVNVELWNLDRKDGEPLLDSWHVDAEKLRGLWLMSFMKANYRLSFDVAENISTSKEPLTVKVTFTDYMGGKVFKEQKVIRP